MALACRKQNSIYIRFMSAIKVYDNCWLKAQEIIGTGIAEGVY